MEQAETVVELETAKEGQDKLEEARQVLEDIFKRVGQ